MTLRLLGIAQRTHAIGAGVAPEVRATRPYPRDCRFRNRPGSKFFARSAFGEAIGANRPSLGAFLSKRNPSVCSPMGCFFGRRPNWGVIRSLIRHRDGPAETQLVFGLHAAVSCFSRIHCQAGWVVGRQTQGEPKKKAKKIEDWPCGGAHCGPPPLDIPLIFPNSTYLGGRAGRPSPWAHGDVAPPSDG